MCGSPPNAHDEPAEVGGVLVVEVTQVQVRPGHEQCPERPPQRPRTGEHPAVVAPDDPVLDVGAALAVPVTLPLARRLGQHQGLQRERRTAGLQIGRARPRGAALGRLGDRHATGGRPQRGPGRTVAAPDPPSLEPPVCHSDASRPPAAPGAVPAASDGPLELQGADGTRVLAHEARPTTPSGVGIVILPDVRPK